MSDTAPHLAQRAAAAGVCMALVLMALKAYAAYRTNSVAMLGSLADSGLDVLASGVTLFGVRLAAQPADDKHRFGHGKAESLAALFQVAVIAVSAVAIGGRAIGRLFGAQVTAEPGTGILVSVAALGATLALVGYQNRVIAATGSVAIGADRVHYTADLLLNGAVIAALVLDGYVGVKGADPFFGIAIALWLFFGAWRASAQAIDQLMDKEWPLEKRRRFVEIASRHPELKGLHDLRTRTSGAHDFVQFHVWMDPDMTIAAAHDAMEEVERQLAHEFPGTEILIHIDPEGQVDRPENPLVEIDEIALLKEPRA